MGVAFLVVGLMITVAAGDLVSVSVARAFLCGDRRKSADEAGQRLEVFTDEHSVGEREGITNQTQRIDVGSSWLRDMTSTTIVAPAPVKTATLDDVANKRQAGQAAAVLVRLAGGEGVSLTGPDGLLKQLTNTHTGFCITPEC